MNDRYGAFCEGGVRIQPFREGSLSGLTFAAKDVFDVAGRVAGAGNPDWKRTHAPASRHAPAIELLLREGATLVGMTHTDELMFGLQGENDHYGTPVNPSAEQRIPGGSSSGSAVCVASGAADFALGTDTAGSVRVPASYCGVYGFRPSRGGVSLEGVVPLAPMFDTVGWFASDPRVLTKVGSALLGTEPPDADFRRLLIAGDLMALADESYQDALAPYIDRIVGFLPEYSKVVAAEEGVQARLDVFRSLQGWDVWRTHRAWIEEVRPTFGLGAEERFQWASTLQALDIAPLLEAQRRSEEKMRTLLGRDGLILAPTTPGVPPPRHTRGREMDIRRRKTLQLCCIASLAGLPQATIPFIGFDGLPIGLSFIAGPGEDRRLLRWVERVAEQLRQEPIRKE